MKVVGITRTAILSLFFGIVAPVYAQQQSEKQDHPEKPQAGQHEQVKPEQQHAPPQHAQQQDQNKQEHAQQQRQQSQNKQHAQQQEHAQQQAQDRNKQQQLTQQQRSHEQQRVEQTAWQSSIGQETGSQTIAHGNNVAATVATASPTTATMGTLGQAMGSELRASPSWSLADIRASSTVAIGSALLIRGQGTGRMTGMTLTTST
jgi:outer membrane biosynthesis protein TonB